MVRYHPMENAFNNSFRAINASTLRHTSSLGAKGVTIFVVTAGGALTLTTVYPPNTAFGIISILPI